MIADDNGIDWVHTDYHTTRDKPEYFIIIIIVIIY
jgi:hypothetical protein